MVSLVVSTALTAFGDYLDSVLPFGKVILTVLNVLVSLMLISFLFRNVPVAVEIGRQASIASGH
jgi:hypothetical protein